MSDELNWRWMERNSVWNHKSFWSLSYLVNAWDCKVTISIREMIEYQFNVRECNVSCIYTKNEHVMMIYHHLNISTTQKKHVSIYIYGTPKIEKYCSFGWQNCCQLFSALGTLYPHWNWPSCPRTSTCWTSHSSRTTACPTSWIIIWPTEKKAEKVSEMLKIMKLEVDLLSTKTWHFLRPMTCWARVRTGLF